MNQENRTTTEGSPDPAVDAFLDFLARDMAAHPEHIAPLSESPITRIKELIGHDVGLKTDMTALETRDRFNPVPMPFKDNGPSPRD